MAGLADQTTVINAGTKQSGGYVLVKLKDLNIKHEYCECGCKHNEVKCGPLNFPIFQTLKGQTILRKSNSMLHEEIFVTYEEAATRAEELILKEVQKLIKAFFKEPKPKKVANGAR